MKFNQFPSWDSVAYTRLSLLKYEPEIHANSSMYVFDVSFAAHVPLFINNHKHPCVEHFVLYVTPQKLQVDRWLADGVPRGRAIKQRFIL